jgi:ribose 1,5-bisphosphokinase PhnN
MPPSMAGKDACRHIFRQALRQEDRNEISHRGTESTEVNSFFNRQDAKDARVFPKLGRDGALRCPRWRFPAFWPAEF